MLFVTRSINKDLKPPCYISLGFKYVPSPLCLGRLRRELNWRANYRCFTIHIDPPVGERFFEGLVRDPSGNSLRGYLYKCVY